MQAMNATQNMYHDAFNKAKKIMEESKIGLEGSSGLTHPFFQFGNSDNEVDIMERVSRNCSKEHFQEVNKTFENVNIPKCLLMIYYWLECNDREFQYVDLNWMSLKAIWERLQVYRKEGQQSIIDLAYRYAGMGWINVLSMDVKTGKFFYRADGGSSGYDREENWNRIKSLDISTMNPDKLHTFDEIIRIARQPQDGPFME